MAEEAASFEFQAPKPVKITRSVPISDEDGDPLSPMSCLFHKPGNSICIMILVGLKTRVDPEHFKAETASACLGHPRFTSLLVADKTDITESSANLRWVKTKIDIEQHVFVCDVESKDTAQVGVDKYVEDYTRDLTRVPLDMSKPLWDVHVLNLDEMTSQGAMAVAIFRIHHSIGDGTSILSLFMSFTRKASDKNAAPAYPTFTKNEPRNRSSCSIKERFWTFFWVLWITLVDILNFLAATFFVDDTPNPLKGPKDGASQKGRRITMKSVRMEDIKTVKNITKTTVNDVVMGIVESGLTRYLNRKYGEINKHDNGLKVKKSNGSNLPQKLRFRALICVNMRALSGYETIAEMMKNGSLARWGNHLGYAIYPFKIMLRENNPLDYVYRAQSVMNRKKASLELHFSYHFVRFMTHIFGLKYGVFPTNTTIWFSNMMGPQEEMTLFDYPMAYIGGSVFGQPVALMIHALSYAGSMNFILSSDEDVIPNPHELCDDLEKSLELIKMAATAKLKNEDLKE